MRLLALALVLALGAPTAAAPRRGRVVRIERPRTSPRGTPRVCQYNAHDQTATCFGLAPVVGEIGALVAEPQPAVNLPGARGRAKVLTVEATNPAGTATNSCAAGLWKATLEVDSATPPDSYGTWLLIEVGAGPGSQLVPAPDKLPSGETGEQPAVTLDREGDGRADFLVTWFPCPGTGASSQVYCVDFWDGGDSHWRKLRRDTVTWCM